MKVGILLYHDVLELDAAGPHTVLRTAARYTDQSLEVFTLGRTRSSVKGAGGLVMTPEYPIVGSAPEMDALIVPGGPGAEKAGRDATIGAFLRERAPGLRVLGAVSTGAMVLGEAGLLEGLIVTTWPPLLEKLWAYKPADVVRDRIVRNPNDRYFAAEITAGIDLGLEIVSHAFGLETARSTAEHLGYAWTPLEPSASATRMK